MSPCYHHHHCRGDEGSEEYGDTDGDDHKNDDDDANADADDGDGDGDGDGTADDVAGEEVRYVCGFGVTPQGSKPVAGES